MSREPPMIGLYEKACTKFFTKCMVPYIQYPSYRSHFCFHKGPSTPRHLSQCASENESCPCISAYNWQLESNTRVLDLEYSGLSIWSCVFTQHVFQCQLLGYQFIPPIVHWQTKHSAQTYIQINQDPALTLLYIRIH